VSSLSDFFSEDVHIILLPLFPIITIGPFMKWGIDFTTCHPPLARGATLYHRGCRLLYEVGGGHAYFCE
jgi:hypothetical protein